MRRLSLVLLLCLGGFVVGAGAHDTAPTGSAAVSRTSRWQAPVTISSLPAGQGPLYGPLVALDGRGKEAANFDIIAIDLVGRQTNITHNPADDLAPAVALDGRIAFVSTRSGNGADLYVMDGDGRNVRSLTTGDMATWDDALDLSQESWSPRGDKIAYDGLYAAVGPPCEHDCALWGVLILDSDGSGLKQIAPNGRAPAWSPDGRRLAYESDVDIYNNYGGGVTITRLDGSGSVHLNAFNPSGDVGPVWAPNGDELAFQASRAEGFPSSIYVVRPDGRRKRRLALGHNPTWSPDGRRLAFIDHYKLFTIDRDGGRKRRVSRQGEFVIGEAWSPRGAMLAYVAGTRHRNGGLPTNLRVETASGNGTRVHVLAREPDFSTFGPPVWTPDGRRILVAVDAH